VDAIELLKHDHRMVEQLFRDYDAAASDRQRRGVVEIAIRELSKHAALEELTVYPFARQLLPAGAVNVDELGQQLDKAKHTAPTRPHPMAPDQPPALAMAAPVAAIYDRVRNRLQGRPKT
jgi:hemerythrin superfamily protein